MFPFLQGWHVYPFTLLELGVGAGLSIENWTERLDSSPTFILDLIKLEDIEVLLTICA